MAFVVTWYDIPAADRFELSLPKAATILQCRGPSAGVAQGIMVLYDLADATPAEDRTFFLRATDDPIDTEVDHQLVWLGTFRVDATKVTTGELHLFEYQETGP